MKHEYLSFDKLIDLTAQQHIIYLHEWHII